MTIGTVTMRLVAGCPVLRTFMRRVGTQTAHPSEGHRPRYSHKPNRALKARHIDGIPSIFHKITKFSAAEGHAFTRANKSHAVGVTALPKARLEDALQHRPTRHETNAKKSTQSPREPQAHPQSLPASDPVSKSKWTYRKAPRRQGEDR